MDFRIACLVTALCFGSGVQAAAMSKDTYKAQQVRIEGEYDMAQAKCKPLKGNSRDVCMEQVRGARDIQIAELELQYKPTPDADEKLRLAKAEAVHAVALQRCTALDGSSAKEVCRREAKAVFAGAKAEARLQKDVVKQEMRSQQVVQQRSDAADKQTEAQFTAARERCEMLPGEGRENCLADAKKRFGKL